MTEAATIVEVLVQYMDHVRYIYAWLHGMNKCMHIHVLRRALVQDPEYALFMTAVVACVARSHVQDLRHVFRGALVQHPHKPMYVCIHV